MLIVWLGLFWVICFCTNVTLRHGGIPYKGIESITFHEKLLLSVFPHRLLNNPGKELFRDNPEVGGGSQ